MNQLTFISRARSIFSDNNAPRVLPRQRCGPMLDYARLGMVAAGENRVFKKPVRRSCADYAVGILTDFSGSMNPHKIREAAHVLHALAFSLIAGGVKTLLLRGFNQRYISIEIDVALDLERLIDFCVRAASSPGYAGNHDGYAVTTMRDELLRVAAGARLILVLSDGEPICGRRCSNSGCESNGMSGSEMLHKAIALSRRAGVECLAVGIMTSAPVQYYGKRRTAVVEDMRLFYSKMAALLYQNLRRG